MKYFKYLFVITLLSFCISLPDANAQDPRFSQFYASPLQLNPAMTGVFEGRWRVNANYRDQWSAVLEDVPFRTSAASFDARYKVFRNDYFGFGVNVLHDEGGVGNYQTNRGSVNLSYIKQLSGGGYGGSESYLVAGAQAGAGQHGTDWNQFWFTTQFDGAPNTNLSNEEPGLMGDNGNTDIYTDFNAGILWYALFANDATVYVGFAGNHLNQPDISLLDGSSESLHTRWVGHAGGEIPFSHGLSLMPAISMQFQGPHMSTTVGANLRYTNHDWNEVAIRAGLWPHMTSRVSGEDSKLSMDAMTVALILEMNRVNFGLSYDVTTSNFQLANNARGAFELSIIYVHPAYERVKTKCPKF
ncbi:MAG: type IX secretion system PorP/SprF family membrane protein [Patescibacteria group bacterium]|jgi:type IX secretion system PorP/SprF family membrane protein